ncbi:MAG: pyridoxal-dependent decarboxylase [Planctomycetota bacterium]
MQETDLRHPLADAADIVAAYVEKHESGDAVPMRSVDECRDLPIALAEEGVGDEEALRRLREVVLETPTTSGPRFMNQLFAGREHVATVAEAITTVMNVSMYTFKAGGPQILIEREVLERMMARADMTGGDGMFTPGGSLSNLAAMIVGRNEITGHARDEGFDGRKRTVYCSEECHYSLTKSVNMIGVGTKNLRTVEADDLGRMIPEKLREQMAADRDAGLEPLMIVATSGTTVMGAFDPIEPLAPIRDEFGVWLHVDGAFGGTALMHPEKRDLMRGIGLADSLTWDAHKAMGVPITCSVALTRERGLMRKHFDAAADYLFQQDFAEEDGWLNPGTRSLQCGRRNDALKLWTLWQSLGDRGFAERIDRQLANAAAAARFADEHPEMTLSFEPSWLNVCFEVNGKKSDAICEMLSQSGVLKVGHGIVKGRRVVRMNFSSTDFGPEDVERMMRDVLIAASDAPDGDNAI